MKIKVFNIRLSKEHFESDQNKLNDFLENVTFKKSTASLVENPSNYWTILIHYEEINHHQAKPIIIPEKNKSSEITEDDLILDELVIVKKLKEWRLQKAQEEGFPAYMILSNLNIFTLAKYKPQLISDFLSLKGFGEKKTERYGDELMDLLNSV